MKKICNDILKFQSLSSSEKNVLLYLNTIASCDKATISLVDLSQAINITKPTVIKALHSLEEKELIEKSNEGKRYSKNIYKLKSLKKQ